MASHGSRTISRWCFTLNNPDVGGEEFLERVVASLPCLRYCVFQLERGESGTPHFQGYIELKRSQRLSYMRRLSSLAHYEEAKGNGDQNEKYCTKDDDRLSGPWRHGERVSQGQRTDLQAAADVLAEGGSLRMVAREHPTVYVKYSRGLAMLQQILSSPSPEIAPEVHLLIGPPGCGKTREIYEKEEADDLFVCPLSNGTLWFDGYDRQEAILLDDFAGRGSHVTLSSCLQLLDRYNPVVPVKGGHVRLVHKRLYITTNLHPRDWYDYSTRRIHQRALARRFTVIYQWRPIFGFAELEKHEIKNTDTNEWASFWSEMLFAE